MTPAAIRALRQRFGESQEEFANRLGVSPKSVWNWEAGKSFPHTRAVQDRLEQAMRHAPGYVRQEA